MAQGLGNETRRRIALVFVLVTVTALALLGRLFYLQVAMGSVYSSMAENQWLRPLPVEPRRGTIYDRNHEPLAVSLNSMALYAMPGEIKDPESVAGALAPIVDMPADQIEKRLKSESSFVWLSRSLEPEAAARIRSLRLPGLGLTERYQRYYPNGELAANLIGIVGVDNQGLEGIEYQLDHNLAGVRGKEISERDSAGRKIPGGVTSSYAPTNGDDVILTIDKVIQYIAETEVREAVEKTGSRAGTAVVMDPKTGELLALAVYPTFDPNRYNEYPAEHRRNIAITDLYEPGSTFKIVTSAAALEENAVQPGTLFEDRGSVRIGGIKVSCWKPGGHGKETFVQAVQNSCNPVFSEVALERLGPETFYDYIKAFGFGSKTGIEFPGEAAGYVPDPALDATGKEAQWATIGFGQGIAVTPLQLATAVSAVANRGILLKPALVKEIRGDSGELVYVHEPARVREVISGETAAQLTEILVSVVDDGTGKTARIDGYSVAGKTGTAQAVDRDRGGYGSERIASFIGYAPAEDPRITVLVVLYEPESEVKYGSVIAAPVFKSIAEQTLRYLEVPPKADLKDESKFKTAETGDGTTVGSSAELYFPEDEKYNGSESGRDKPAGTSPVVVPNLRGKSLRDALQILERVGLESDPNGSGFVYSQEPVPGERVAPGTVVKLELKEIYPR